jgi:ubiquinone/menaquinone biosynthesis C-methylase UbiE
MGFWARQVTPRLVDSGSDDPKIMPLRAEACRGLRGDVVELGFGSGPNTTVYPPQVTSVVAVEPSDVAWRRSEQRRAASRVPVTRGSLDGQHLDLPDDSADAVLSTFTLCTIPDLPLALAEVRRVLRPGGALHFFEHGIAPDESVRRWQRRLEPLQKRAFDGCHLTRPIDRIVADSGLELERLETAYGPFPRAMRPWTYGYLGRAVSA